MAGLVVGLLGASAALLGWRVPPGSGAAGTDVRIVTLATGPVALEPVGVVATGTDLGPGSRRAADGRVAVRNVTGSRAAIRLRAIPSDRAMDGLLWFEVRSPAGTLYRGALGELRSWTRQGFTLSPGASTTLEIRAWLPSSVRSGFEGRIEDVTLQWRTVPA